MRLPFLVPPSGGAKGKPGFTRRHFLQAVSANLCLSGGLPPLRAVFLALSIPG